MGALPLAQAVHTISVIIPAYGECPHLVHVVEALLLQTRAPDEIIVVHSGTHDPTHTLTSLADSVSVVHFADRKLAGQARNIGTNCSRCNVFAFVDADVLPIPSWLQMMEEALGQAWGDFVVGSIGYQASGGYWGLCLWASEFSGVHPYLRSQEQVDGASANVLIPRVAFDAAGGFPENFQPGEDTALFARLRALNLRQWFCAKAEVRHFNISGFGNYWRHQYKLGQFGAVCRRFFPLKGQAATKFWPLATGLWLARLWILCRRMAQDRSTRGAYRLWLMPGLILGLLVWNIGFLSGLTIELNKLNDNQSKNSRI